MLQFLIKPTKLGGGGKNPQSCVTSYSKSPSVTQTVPKFCVSVEPVFKGFTMWIYNYVDVSIISIFPVCLLLPIKALPFIFRIQSPFPLQSMFHGSQRVTDDKGKFCFTKELQLEDVEGR